MIRRIHGTNLATGAQVTFDEDLCPQDNRLWSVTPGEPIEQGGRRLDDFIEEPGDYAFSIELRFELPSAEFEGRVE